MFGPNERILRDGTSEPSGREDAVTESDADRWRWGPKPQPAPSSPPSTRETFRRWTTRILGAVAAALLLGTLVYVDLVAAFMPPRHDWIARATLGTFFSIVAVGALSGARRDDPDRWINLTIGLLNLALAVAIFAGLGHICHFGDESCVGDELPTSSAPESPSLPEAFFILSGRAVLRG
jgi:hypothetical protein